MGNSVLQFVVKGLLGRFLAYGALATGFLLLYRGLQVGNLGTGVPLVLGGGTAILIGMYLMVTGRRGEPPTERSEPLDPLGPGSEEDGTGDPIDGSNQGA